MNHAALMVLIRSKQKITYRGAAPSLRQIAYEAHVQPSTLTRLLQDKDISVRALLSILLWLRKHGENWNHLMAVICDDDV